MSRPEQPTTLTVTPLPGIPEVREGDDLAALLLAAVGRAGTALAAGDILAVSSKIASKALGLTAAALDKEAVVAAETVRVVAERRNGGRVTRIVESAAGPVMAAAGVDASNTGGRDLLLLLPHDPDAVCRRLLAALRTASGVSRLGVVLTDTAGRPWRVGQTDFALGAAGVRALVDLRGSVDADGRALAVTSRALGDEIAAAADLVKGKATGVPAALVRGLVGLVLDPDDCPADAGARPLVGTPEWDWFALGDQEAVRAALGVPPGGAPAAQAGIRPTSGDTREARIARALRVALPAHPDPGQAGRTGTGTATVTITGPAPEAEGIVVAGADDFGVGLVTARALVALAGEGVPHRLVAHEPGRARLVPAVD